MSQSDAKQFLFTLVGHAHIDPVWLWDWREGYETVKATFRSALDRIAENPDLVFAHSSAAQYRWMEDHPELLDEIRAAVRRGQWEPVGGWWVEPDANIPSGESLARQGLYGQRYMKETLGRTARVGFLPDSFGHAATLPQILRQAGLRYFLFMRPGADEMDLPSNAFWWEGPDGSKVLAVRVECYNTNPGFITSSLERNLAWRPERLGEWVGLYGVGNHGGGPTKRLIQSIRDLDKDPEWPRLRLGSLEQFFERIEGEKHPIVNRELQHHARGCYSAHSGIKAQNRRAEHALLTAEKWSVIAGAFGYPRPGSDLAEAWKAVLFNQFHDILAGSSIPQAYVDAANEIGGAVAAAERVLFGALQAVASRVETRRQGRRIDEVIRRPRWSFESWVADLGDGVPVVVFNPHPWPRREVLEVEVNDWLDEDLCVLDNRDAPVVCQRLQPKSAVSGRPRVAFTADVPPLGYRVYRIVDEPAPSVPAGALPLRATPTTLENAWWRLEADPKTGAIRSLYDKEQQQEVLSGPGARLVVVDDPSDTWGHGVVRLDREAGIFEDAEVRLIQDGPVQATLAVSSSFGASRAIQEITLYRESPQIRGRLRINWQEAHRALKLSFPLAVEEAQATYDVPYGHVIRDTNGEEEPLQQWMDVTGVVRDRDGRTRVYGAALLNDGKYGGDVDGSEMRLTILRSPVYAHHDPYRLGEGKVYEYQDQGWHETRWELFPHAGPWQDAGVVRAAYDLNAPLLFVREYAHEGTLENEGSFVEVQPADGAVLTVLKHGEDGDALVVRMYEPHGRPARVTVSLPFIEASFAAELAPHEIATFRLEGDGSVRRVDFLEGDL